MHDSGLLGRSPEFGHPAGWCATFTTSTPFDAHTLLRSGRSRGWRRRRGQRRARAAISVAAAGLERPVAVLALLLHDVESRARGSMSMKLRLARGLFERWRDGRSAEVGEFLIANTCRCQWLLSPRNRRSETLRRCAGWSRRRAIGKGCAADAGTSSGPDSKRSPWKEECLAVYRHIQPVDVGYGDELIDRSQSSWRAVAVVTDYGRGSSRLLEAFPPQLQVCDRDHGERQSGWRAISAPTSAS